MLLWCLAKLAHPPPAWWLTKYATAITAQLHAYTPSNSAVTLSSMGNLPWVPGAELMEQLLQHMKAQLPLFSVKELAAVSQGLSNVYAAAVRLDAVQGVAAAKQKRLTAVQLSQSAAWQVIWADWMVVSQDRLHDAGPQELMIMAVSVAKARGPGVSDAWMGSLYAAVARCWAVADGRLCSGVLWAVVKLKQVSGCSLLMLGATLSAATQAPVLDCVQLQLFIAAINCKICHLKPYKGDQLSVCGCDPVYGVIIPSQLLCSFMCLVFLVL